MRRLPIKVSAVVARIFTPSDSGLFAGTRRDRAAAQDVPGGVGGVPPTHSGETEACLEKSDGVRGSRIYLDWVVRKLY